MFRFPPENHGELIANIASLCGYRSYLELGLNGGHNIKRIAHCVDVAIGVCKAHIANADWEGKFQYHNKTTNEFFESFEGPVDLIFIDADHSERQVVVDLENSMRVLAPGGLILIHDLDPMNIHFTNENACGDGYKLLNYFERNYPEWNYCVLPVQEAGVTFVNRKADRRALKF